MISPSFALFHSQLIRDCNSNVQRMRRTEELIYLSQKIEFECKVSCPCTPPCLCISLACPTDHPLTQSSSLHWFYLSFCTFLEYASDHFILQDMLIGRSIELYVDFITYWRKCSGCRSIDISVCMCIRKQYNQKRGRGRSYWRRRNTQQMDSSNFPE